VIVTKLISVTNAQWTLLQRIVRGIRLPLKRYSHVTSAQVRALSRKHCIAHVGHAHWVITRFGRELIAGKGKALYSDAEHGGKFF
jgi:hypothetical protein